VFISTLKDILNAEELREILDLLKRAPFVDGQISGGNIYEKKNLELAPDSKEYLSSIELVEKAVRRHPDFNFTAFPRSMTRAIISRYDSGMFYNEHIDLPIMNFFGADGKPAHRGLAPLGNNYVRSDLSMTLFLTPADSYEGGELGFKGPFGLVKAKLDAGSAILYPTGTPHSVTTVRSGIRMAAIFWIQTMFPVEAERQAVYDALHLARMLEKSHPDSPEAAAAQRNAYNLFRLLAAV
jgi:PKHD-type hydroxylase